MRTNPFSSRPPGAAAGPAHRRATAIARLTTAVALVLLAACSAAPRGRSEESWMEYLETARRLAAAGPTLAPDSPEEGRAIARFQDLLRDFKAPDFAARVGEVYADDAFFNDTLKTLRGAAEIEDHLAATADGLDEGTVDFVDLAGGDGDYYFRWVMTVRAKRLAGGAPTTSVGMSHVRFDAAGKVVLHQDFWDSAGGLFEHVPVLGWMLRRAKGRL